MPSPLVDSNTYRVLASLSTPKPASDISDSTGIPIASVYRVLEELSETDLVIAWREHRVGAGGDPLVYQRTRDEVTIAFEPPAIEARVERAERLNKRS